MFSLTAVCWPLPERTSTRSQIIVTVALVPPKKGVFQEAVKHVLAVATTVEVILLAVTFQGEQSGGNPRNRRIQVSVLLPRWTFAAD